MNNKDYEFQTYRNFLNTEDIQVINNTIAESKWTFLHSSSGVLGEGDLFWKFHLNEKDNPYFYNELFNKVKEVTQSNYILDDVYFNGHMACSGGDLHKDLPQDNARTFLVYCNEVWRPEQGGGTIFVFDNDNIETVFPRPRSAVLFSGNRKHCALPVGKNFHGIRITLAYKLLKV